MPFNSVFYGPEVRHLTAQATTKEGPAESRWPDVIERIEPLVWRVQAGRSVGTAFAISVADSGDGVHHTMFVTAWHVVKDIVQTDDVLDLVRGDGTLLSTLVAAPTAIYPVGPSECDTALILVRTREPLVAMDSLPAMPLETMLVRGTDVGWLGFPGLVFPELCFFRGVVSGYQEKPPIYLIDGVAINGVSGGPAFDRTGLLVGFVSAYVPNQIAPGTTLPGLMIVTPLNLVRLWMQELFKARVTMRS